MDNSELKSLEEKTKKIVTTLDKLEKEIKEYQKKNVDLVAGVTGLANVSEQIAAASKGLSSVATLFKNSDFSKAMKEIDKRINKINQAEIVLTDQSEAINSIVKNVLAEYKNLSNEIKTVNESVRESLSMQNSVIEMKELLEAMAFKVDRIDRNTQKGFGKERG